MLEPKTFLLENAMHLAEREERQEEVIIISCKSIPHLQTSASSLLWRSISITPHRKFRRQYYYHPHYSDKETKVCMQYSGTRKAKFNVRYFIAHIG